MILPNRPITTNFTTGEISPRLHGRVDLEQYGDAAATLDNFLVIAAGGLTRRPGSCYVGTCLAGAGQVRVIPFIVSNLTAYVLELGPLYMRFWRNRGPVLDADGNPLQLATPYAQSDLRLIRYAQSADVLYMAVATQPPQKLSRTSENTFTLEAVPFQNGPYDTENTGDVGATGTPAPATAPEGPVPVLGIFAPTYPDPTNGGA